MQQRAQLLEPLPALFVDGRQARPSVQRVPRVGVHADVLVVAHGPRAVAIERDRRAREVNGVAGGSDHDLHATRIRDECGSSVPAAVPMGSPRCTQSSDARQGGQRDERFIALHIEDDVEIG